MFKQEELSTEDWETMERFYFLMCEDILTQRRRIGGDWVMAGGVPLKRFRDRIRSAILSQ